MMSDDVEGPVAGNPKRAQNRFRLIVGILTFIAACVIAAIVLPLVLNDCNCPKSSPSIRSPTLQPTAQPTTLLPEPSVPTVDTAAPTSLSVPTFTLVPTPLPSSPSDGSPTSRLNQFIEAYLIPVSGEEVFQDPSSPQYRAAEFLANGDTVGSQLGDLVQLGDRYALSTFYYSMDGDGSWFSCYQNDGNCTTGNPWMDPEVNHCDWSAIRCDTTGRVLDIFFATSVGNGLVGTIPSEISLLNRLENLVAVSNLIGGTLPSSLGAMSNLKRLILQTNLMSGSIPQGFLGNSPLELLVISNNRFLGDIPSSLGGIATLTQLRLANNRFEGTIPRELGNPELLGTLDISDNNRLLGSIPSEVFGLANLKHLYVNGCTNIAGQLNANIAGLSSIEILRLGGTGLQGTLPSELFTLTGIVELDLSNAGFSGTLSENFSLLAESLRRLYLSGNSFSGAIPTAFDFMSFLNELQLDNNNLIGSISSTLCQRRGDQQDSLNVLTSDCDEVSCSCCTNACTV